MAPSTNRSPISRPHRSTSASHLQALDQVRVRPADLLREASEHAEAAAGRHLDDLESVGHNHALLLVVGGRDSLEALQTEGKVNHSGTRSKGRGRKGDIRHRLRRLRSQELARLFKFSHEREAYLGGGSQPCAPAHVTVFSNPPTVPHGEHGAKERWLTGRGWPP